MLSAVSLGALLIILDFSDADIFAFFTTRGPLNPLEVAGISESLVKLVNVSELVLNRRTNVGDDWADGKVFQRVPLWISHRTELHYLCDQLVSVFVLSHVSLQVQHYSAYIIPDAFLEGLVGHLVFQSQSLGSRFA